MVSDQDKAGLIAIVVGIFLFRVSLELGPVTTIIETYPVIVLILGIIVYVKRHQIAKVLKINGNGKK